VRIQRPRARRYKLTASIELTDVHTEEHCTGRSVDISLYGCRVVTSKPFATATKIRIRIAHKGKTLTARGTVAYIGLNGEMGITFTSVELKDQLILEQWVAESRNEPRATPHERVI
jgi:c-di-GMP-binding flagellar brake protein YcgR